MSLLVKTDDREFNVNLSQDQETKLFTQIMRVIFGIKADDAIAINPVKQAPEVIPEPVVKVPQEAAAKVPGYKGFMLMKCEHCGKVRGYCAKDEQNKYICISCKKATAFKDDIKRLYMNCKCGTISVYWTNITDNVTEIDCIECGAPVAVKYNDKKNVYETLR